MILTRNTKFRMVSTKLKSISIRKLTRRNFSSNDDDSPKKLQFGQYGEPEEVVQMCPDVAECPECNLVVVKVLASPVNVADINRIQGKYPAKPKRLPATPGLEGCGEIIRVGPDACNLKVGDRVIGLNTNLGWWRNELMVPEKDLFKVPNFLGKIEAATLSSVLTAYRILKDYVCLKKNDVIIQSGGNSTVGTFVIQLCREWGVKTINVIRDRKNLSAMEDYLRCLGATSVVTDKDLECGICCDKIGKPILAVDAVGGKIAKGMLKTLENKANFVVYGAMSRKPVEATLPFLVFKGIIIQGFWLHVWLEENLGNESHIEMLNDIICLYKEDKLQRPQNQLIKFEDYLEALCNTMQGNKKGKYVLDIGQPEC